MKKQKGQTLLEILLAFSVSILVLSAVILGIITSLNNAQYAKNQGLANSYAQEGMAVVKQIRDSSWSDLNNLSLGNFNNNTKYCIGQDLVLRNDEEHRIRSDLNCSTTGHGVGAGGIFSREVLFEHNSLNCCSNDSLNCSTGTKGSKAAIVVSWSDNKCPIGSPFCHKVELVTCFSSIDLKLMP
jgi:type II secretory pathway pseudopilin PulG